MTHVELDTLLMLLSKLERATTTTTIARLARSLFQKVTRAKYDSNGIHLVPTP